MKPTLQLTHLLEDRQNLVKKRVFVLQDMPQKQFQPVVYQRFVDLFLPKCILQFLTSFTDEALQQFVLQNLSFLQKSASQETSIEIVLNTLNLSNKNLSLIQILLKDRPFVVDSLEKYLHYKEIPIVQLVHPLLTLELDEGKLSGIMLAEERRSSRFSFITVAVEQLDAAEAPLIQQELEEIYALVNLCTNDFSKTKHRLKKLAAKMDEPVSEALMDAERRNLLHWFSGDSMILLGASCIEGMEVGAKLKWDNIKSTLGYFSYWAQKKPATIFKQLEKPVQLFLRSNVAFNFLELSEHSKVHSRHNIMLILYKSLQGEDDQRIHCFPVLFTQKTKFEDVTLIPLARLKINHALEVRNIEEGSHDYKEALDFFRSLPKSELFRVDRQEVGVLLDQARFAEEIKQPKVFVFAEKHRGYARLTLFLPKENVPPDMFEYLEGLCNQYLKTTAVYQHHFIYRHHWFMHLVYVFPEDHAQTEGVNFQQLEARITEKLKSWLDVFFEKLVEKPKFQNFGKRLAAKFSEVYKASHTPEQAVLDVQCWAEINKEQPKFLRLEQHSQTESSLHLYTDRAYFLSELLPKLQGLHVTVKQEETFLVEYKTKLWKYEFKLRHRKVAEDFQPFAENFCQVFKAILEDKLKDNWFNSLATDALLTPRQIQLVNAYCFYSHQLPQPHVNALRRVVIESHGLTKLLVLYFEAKFAGASSEKQLLALQSEIEQGILQVQSLAEDFIFKMLLNLIQATVRTNYFNQKVGEVIALKIESQKVRIAPEPKPLFEIFVYGVDMQGIHLRNGLVARGGLRYSNRRDDFRTEVLGLMKTQVLKNAVIAAEGAKGGFVINQVPDNKQAAQAEIVRQYKRFVLALLDLTDNLENHKPAIKKNMHCYDDHDPYLVVAADKGTAQFSDIANALSLKRKFWLKDAFASGGSNGYNHKQVGITARGAWECAKLHFLELKRDIQKSSFTVIGIGDMGGDVFGNGMLQSVHTRLIGAFNHVHIFIDPEPDAGLSYKERERLFNNPGLSWKDYDPQKISAGGGVFARQAKSIALPLQVRKMLGVAETAVSGERLVQLLLQCQADLLFNGGIGTYVKSTAETQEEVLDSVNNNVRINATELKALVVVEGGNLGLTQKARIEYAILGGKINTDAIDNSAGVDMSDHEVNLKILLDGLLETGKIKSQAARNQLIQQLSAEVTTQCLQANIDQGRILSLEQKRSQNSMNRFQQLIDFLVDKAHLDKETEQIPAYEFLQEYQDKNIGLPRPVLSVLLSYTKIFLRQQFNQLTKAGVVQNEALQTKVFVSYFPKSLRQHFDLTQISHPLRPQIVGTLLANRFADQFGMSTLIRLIIVSQIAPVRIVEIYLAVDELFNGSNLRASIYQHLEHKNLALAYQLHQKWIDFITELVLWLLFNQPIESLNANYWQGCEQAMEGYLVQEKKLIKDLEPQINHWTQQGVPPEVAYAMAATNPRQNCLEVFQLQQQHGLPFLVSLKLLKNLEQQFGLAQLQDLVLQTEKHSFAEIRHAGILTRRLNQQRQQLLNQALNLDTPTPNQPTSSQPTPKDQVVDQQALVQWEKFVATHAQPLKKHRWCLQQLLAKTQSMLSEVEVLLADLETKFLDKKQPAK